MTMRTYVRIRTRAMQPPLLLGPSNRACGPRLGAQGGLAYLDGAMSAGRRGRLLLQSNGFEGLICRLVDLETDDLPVPQCPDSGAASLDRHAAYPPLLADSAREDDRICGGGKNLHGIDASFSECRVSLLHERTPRRAAGVHAAIEGIRIRPVKRRLRVDILQRSVEVVIGEPLHHPQHDLHVLLRHRLCDPHAGGPTYAGVAASTAGRRSRHGIAFSS